MNQIIYKSNKIPYEDLAQNFKIEFSNEIFEIPYNENLQTKKKKKQFLKFINLKRYKIQFYISLLIALVFLTILFFHIQNANKQEKRSQELLNNYSLTTLYQDDVDNIVQVEKQSNELENPFVIGMINIDKIDLNYPILSQSNEELLKISLCRFAGPMPNEIGNLCIAGHNYIDDRFFGKIGELEKNDLIEIYDLTGKKINYVVFDKYDVSPNDFSCINQDVGENKVITLLTCNNVSGKRMVVKAKEEVKKE